MPKTRHITSTEMREAAALADHLDETQSSITVEARVLDEEGTELGTIKRLDDDGIYYYAFIAKKGGKL